MNEGGPSGPGKPSEPVSFEQLMRSQHLKDLRTAEGDLADLANTISNHLEEMHKINDPDVVAAHVRALSNQIVIFAGDHKDAVGAQQVFNKTGDTLRLAEQFLQAGAIEPAKQAVRNASLTLIEGLAATYFTDR